MLSALRRRPLFWILLGAFVIRITAAFGLQYYLDHVLKRPYLITGDAEGYWEVGQHIARGEPYELYNPPRRVLRMPGYPAFVAVSTRLADALGVPGQCQHLVARLLLAGVGTIACGLVAILGRELFDATTGWLAASITAIAPPLVGFSVILLSETLFAVALLVSLWCLARLVRAASSGASFSRLCSWAVLSGLAIGGAVYVRPSWLLAAPCFAVLFAIVSTGKRSLREQLLVSAIVLVSTYASLLPWAYRNHEITGHWVFTTLWVGPSLYDGFNPDATGDSNMKFFENERPLDRMSEYDVDRYYRDKAWDFVRANPLAAIKLTAIKVWRFWKPWPSAELVGGSWQSLVGGILVAAYFIPVLLAAVWGWLRGTGHRWAWILTWGPLVYFAVVHAVFLGSLRYRLPVEYPLCIAAAFGLQLMRKGPVFRPSVSH